MIIDSINIEPDKTIKTDICIIGAGPAGITIARELIDSKFNVTLLESGDKDPKEELQLLNSGKNIGVPYHDLQESRMRAFGGSSHRWHVDMDREQDGVRLRGMDKLDFEKRSWVPNSGWPFTKEHLDPYYEQAHKIFKIGPYSYNSDDWEDPKNSPALSFLNGDVKTTIFQFARKNIFYDDYEKDLENAPNITTYFNATVLNIEATKNARKIQSVRIAKPNKEHFSVQAAYFILATGGLENPRLLLLSNNIMKSGLGNQNDLVGRFFMEHPHLWSGVYFPSSPELFNQAKLYGVHESNGVPVMGKLTLSEEILHKERLLNFTMSLHFSEMLVLRQAARSFKIIASALRRGTIPKHSVKHAKVILRKLDCIAFAGLRKIARGNKHDWYSSKDKYHGFILNVMAEQVPNPESRVLLSSELDRFGQNKINLNWDLTSFDIESIRKSQEIIGQQLRKSGLGQLEVELENNKPPRGIHGGRHHMGTTRMHNNPKKGVVDENCKVHGIENLFIAGSSVFPTVGYANPTLTIIALAVRLADHLKNY